MPGGFDLYDDTLSRFLAENVRAIFLETGTFAARPNRGKRRAHVWFAYDTGALYIWDGSSWLLIATGSATYTVKVSTDDTSDKFLEDALAAGTGISLATLNPGGNEQVQITGHASVTLHSNLDSYLLALTGQQLDLDTQAANKIFGGPASGGDAKPQFRDMVDADIPAAIARDSELHTILTIGADAAHSLAGQVLSAVLADAAQVGHVGTGAQTWNGVKTLGSRPLLPASSPAADNEATRKKYVDDEIDADIATHAGIAAAHHSRYTDAEVDAIVATHTAIASAHHALVTLHADLGSNLLALSTQELDLDTQTANYLFAGPASEGVAKPAFRALVAADLSLAILNSLLTTRGDMIRRSATVPERFAKGTEGKVLGMGADDPDWKWGVAAIEYVIDGGGSAIPTGSAGGLIVPFKCFVTGWTVHASGGQTGAITIDVNYHATTVPATASVAGSEKPNIASGSEGEDLTLTTWTQALAKGGSLVFDVDSNGGAHERVVVCLYVDKERAS